MRSEKLKAFMTAVNYLPDRLWGAALSLNTNDRANCEEIRLRLGRYPKVLISGKYITLTYHGEVTSVNENDINDLLCRVTKASFHTYENQIKHGFITTYEGHRVGITGEIIYDGSNIKNLRNITCVNIRIAKPCNGIAEKIINELYRNTFSSTLIISKAGAGKTTLLRDMARILSKKYTVSIADERYEIAGVRKEKSYLDVGDCDVVSGGAKDYMIEGVIRSMSPQIIALDEITGEQDSDSICKMSFLGAEMLATAHAGNLQDLKHRPVYKKILNADIFKTIIEIENNQGSRSYRIYKAEGEVNAQSDWNDNDNYIMLGNRLFSKPQICYPN